LVYTTGAGTQVIKDGDGGWMLILDRLNITVIIENIEVLRLGDILKNG